MTDSEVDIPTIDAIFVVRFDTRLGNTLEWSSSVPGMSSIAGPLLLLPERVVPVWRVESGHLLQGCL